MIKNGEDKMTPSQVVESNRTVQFDLLRIVQALWVVMRPITSIFFAIFIALFTNFIVFGFLPFASEGFKSFCRYIVAMLFLGLFFLVVRLFRFRWWDCVVPALIFLFTKDLSYIFLKILPASPKPIGLLKWAFTLPLFASAVYAFFLHKGKTGRAGGVGASHTN